MKLLIIFALFGFSLAEINSFDDFVLKYKNKSVTDYAIDIGFKTFSHQFNKFKLDFDRKYESEAEEERRKFNFLKTLQFIEKHNELYKKGDETHQAGISLFADLTREEYAQTFSMPSPLHLNISVIAAEPDQDTSLYANLPASFDWHAKGKVTPIKFQGQCGSCWAFASLASIESAYAIKHNQNVILSEQQLVDCLLNTCGGLYIDKALAYVQQHGVEYSSQYPYTGKAKQQCRNLDRNFHARISGYHTLGKAAGSRTGATDDQIMTALMNNGPLALMFDAAGDDFAHYRGGVLTTGVTAWKTVHAVTLVGWGSQNGQNYWHVKNSWGTQWGEAGYFKLARGRDLRGFNEYLYYPVV